MHRHPLPVLLATLLVVSCGAGSPPDLPQDGAIQSDGFFDASIAGSSAPEPATPTGGTAPSTAGHGGSQAAGGTGGSGGSGGQPPPDPEPDPKPDPDPEPKPDPEPDPEPDPTDPCADLYCGDDNTCTTDSCSAGVCQHEANDKACAVGSAAGFCHNSTTCCTGCWDGDSCQPGTSLSACGSIGQACEACSAPVCNTATCGQYGCEATPLPKYTACPGGQCFSGACEPVGGTGERCAGLANTCDPANVCQGGLCVACGMANQVCCGLTTKTCSGSGLVCSGGFCRNCGAKNQPCCAGGTCNAGYSNPMACVSGTCQCGKLGQPCCASPYASLQCESGLKCGGSGYCGPI